MKKILIFVVFVALVAGGTLLYSKRAKAPLNTAASSTPESIASSTTGSKPLDSQDISIENAAWEVFSNYIAYAKKHDLSGIKSLSYQLSPTCQDPKQLSECQKLMDTVVYLSSYMSKNQINNVWYDSKQIILSSDYHKSVQPDQVGYQRAIIYFTRDKDRIKLLSFNPADGIVLANTKGMSTSSLDAKLSSLTKDTDKDGLSDAAETCSSQIIQTCTHTDPGKRDTNGNGWWDGIENLFYKS